MIKNSVSASHSNSYLTPSLSIFDQILFLHSQIAGLPKICQKSFWSDFMKDYFRELRV